MEIPETSGFSSLESAGLTKHKSYPLPQRTKGFSTAFTKP